MNDMFPIKEFGKRINEILEALDGILNEDDINDETAEALEELNAEMEDALALLNEINPAEEGWEEEAEDALDEFESLCDDYQALAQDAPGIAAEVQRLKMNLDMAQANISG